MRMKNKVRDFYKKSGIKTLPLKNNRCELPRAIGYLELLVAYPKFFLDKKRTKTYFSILKPDFCVFNFCFGNKISE